MSASVNVNPSDPSRLLLFEGEHYCHNHLDSYAMHLVLSKAFDAIWMPDPRGHQMLKWFLSGKYNSDLSAVDASRAVLAEVSSLRIPTVDFIPHVGDCSRCEERESHCYSQIMTAEKWICESKVRVSILLDLWASKEVCSLRRLLNEIRYNVVAEPSPSSEAAVRKAKEAMTEAAAIATKRMKVTLKNIDTATDIATLFSGPMAILGATSGNSMLSVLGASVSSGAMTVTAACKLILNERYRWIRLRELNVNDDHSIRDWLAGL